MTKIRIMGPKGLLAAFSGYLQGVGRVHVDSRFPDRQGIGESFLRRFLIEAPTLHDKDSLEIRLEQVKKILLLLPTPDPSAVSTAASAGVPNGTADRLLGEDESKIESLAARLEQLTRKKKVYMDELSILERYEKILHVLSPLVSLVRDSRDLDYLGVTIRMKEKEITALLEQAMDRITQHHYEIFYAPVDSEVLAALLVFPRSCDTPVKALLWEESIGELRLPSSIMDKPLGEAFRIILRKRRDLPRRIELVDRELAMLSLRWYRSIETLKDWFENKMNQILVSASFYETKTAFILYGWMPTREVALLRQNLSGRFQGRVVIDPIPVDEGEGEQPPVLLENPPFLRPFERFTRILPLPKYGTIDPTPYMAAFFPLFFGMMIGDVGYGALLLLTAGIVRWHLRRNPTFRDFTHIFIAASVSSIIWGVLFGEFFGDLGEPLGLHPVLMNRMESFLPNLFLALAFGAFHILVGIGLGITTALKHRRRHEAVVKLTGLALVAGFLVMSSGLIGFLPKAAVTAGLVIVMISVPVLILRGGVAAVMEIHNVVNILSYLRLMGIGVASVSMAFAANKLGGMVENVFLGILIGVILHALNLVFGIFSPTIQSLRLHFVEFFENFYQGGGREYQPFKKTMLERSA